VPVVREMLEDYNIQKIIIYTRCNVHALVECESSRIAEIIKERFDGKPYQKKFSIRIQYTSKPELIVKVNSSHEYDSSLSSYIEPWNYPQDPDDVRTYTNSFNSQSNSWWSPMDNNAVTTGEPYNEMHFQPQHGQQKFSHSSGVRIPNTHQGNLRTLAAPFYCNYFYRNPHPN
jgi:hypothetical protein